MSSTAASSDEEAVRRTQKPAFTSERTKEATAAPKQASQAPRLTQYFPLGYREAFSQWVTISPLMLVPVTNSLLVGHCFASNC